MHTVYMCVCMRVYWSQTSLSPIMCACIQVLKGCCCFLIFLFFFFSLNWNEWHSAQPKTPIKSALTLTLFFSSCFSFIPFPPVWPQCIFGPKEIHAIFGVKVFLLGDASSESHQISFHRLAQLPQYTHPSDMRHEAFIFFFFLHSGAITPAFSCGTASLVQW